MICPVCAYKNLPYPPEDYNICPCCGTEFGNDDAQFTHEQLQRQWIAAGSPWFFGNPPPNWNAWNQLLEGERMQNLPLYSVSAFVSASPISAAGFRIQSSGTAVPMTVASSTVLYA